MASILYVCDFNTHGGTQSHLLHLFRALDRERFEASLVTLNLHPVLRERLRELDVEVTDLGIRGALRATTGKAVLALASRARRSADLLHGYLFQGNVLTAAASALSGVPCVTSVRNLDLKRRPAHRWFSAAAHRKAARVLFNSTVVRDLTVRRDRIPAGRAVVIHNGIPDPRLTSAGSSAMPRDLAGDGRPTVVCLASLREKKGHAFLLEAFGRVRERVPEARLLLVGEGPLGDSLRRRVREARMEGSVAFTGYRADASSILQGSDVFALSSLEEGMPNALLEAMACSLPAVVTDVGGNGEVVEEGVTGYLVPPRQPELMAERITRLLREAPLRERLGGAGRERFEARFTLERMTGAYRKLYDEVLA